jgi:hypothetical protein
MNKILGVCSGGEETLAPWPKVQLGKIVIFHIVNEDYISLMVLLSVK